MKEPKEQISTARREFLRDAGSSAAVATATLVAPGLAAAQPQADADAATPTDGGYRLTQHILDYYKSAAS